MTMTQKACLALAATMMVAVFAGISSANTRTDVGGDDWCPDTQDTDFLVTDGGQVNPTGNQDDYCDANSADSSATVVGTTNSDSIVCNNNPLGQGQAANTQCVGGALSVTDNVVNRGENNALGDDYPQPTGVTFDIAAGNPPMRVNYQICTVVIADNTLGPCYDDIAVNPAGTCVTSGTAPVDMMDAVDGVLDTITPVPATEMPTEAYVYWFTSDPLSCGSINPNPRTVTFDWSYNALTTSGNTFADATVGGQPLTLPAAGDGVFCLTDFSATAGWTTNGGGAGNWLLWQVQQQIGYAEEVSGTPQTVNTEDIGVVPDGVTAIVVSYAYAIGDAGTLARSNEAMCEAGDPVVPLECFDMLDNDGDTQTDYPNDPECEADPTGSEAGGDGILTGILGILPECLSPLDDDGANDGIIWLPVVAAVHDNGCSSPLDDDEAVAGTLQPGCADMLDNDGDTLTDFPDDPECDSPLDDDESL